MSGLMISSTDVNEVWCELMRELLQGGINASPQSFAASEMGNETFEIMASQIKVNMEQPVLGSIARGLSYRFMAAEALWILTGDDRVETITPYCKHMAKYSDDGEIFFGAYGPPLVEQTEYVLDKLRTDPATRQAVMTFWRPNPNVDTKDTPCTISAHWMIRDSRLHCFVNMRSSDVWLGLPYDIFNFTMISLYIALHLRVSLGDMYHTADSRHVYVKHARKWSVSDVQEYHGIQAIELNDFKGPGDLFLHLKALRDREETTIESFREVGEL